MGQIELEHPELFALEFGKIAESGFFYSLVSINVDQLVPNMVTIYMTMTSWMCLIIDLIGSELSGLFALEFAKIAESDFVYTLASTNLDQLLPNMVTIHMTMSSWMSLITSKIQQ